MDLTKLRDMDPDIHQIISRLLRETFVRVGPAAQATTGTTGGGDAGEVAVPGLKANGVVIVTAAESPGSSLTIGHVTAGADKFTVYDGAATPAVIEGKKVNYFVIDLGTA